MTTKKILQSLLLLLSIINFSLQAEVDKEDFATDLVDLYDQDSIVRDLKTAEFNEELTAEELVKTLGFGWNLGNTLDAWQTVGTDEGLASETSWGNPETTEEMIDALVAKGFKAVRIPVTWHNHLIDDKYTISPEWMQRVKTIVDWCIKKGLYVILNTHHDNAVYTNGTLAYGVGYYPLIKDLPESERFLYNVWKQIATAFNNGYDHHLIFEGMNEPRMVNLPNEWWYLADDKLCEESVAVINQLNRLCVTAIRETGGNNKKRYIMVTGHAASFDYTVNSKFEIPKDPENPDEKRLLVSVHMYAPYDFVMNPNMTFTEFTPEYRNELYQNFKQLYTKYVKNGYQIIIGEMGIVNKNNTRARIEWGKYYLASVRYFHMSAFIWDNGIWDNSEKCDDTWAFFRREELTWENGNFIDAVLRVAQNDFEENVQLFEVEPQATYDEEKAIKDYGEKKFDVSLSSKDIIDQLAFGWNLGNTFDAFNNDEQDQGVSSETSWGNPKTTIEMISTLYDKGIKVIRIPVTWHNHLIDDKYTIDPEWMLRVKTVVDWCLDKGLYVILNTHHDNANYKASGLKYGQGYYPLKKDAAESERFIYNIWKQITTAFNNGYDHHLIFEGLNEPRMRDTDYEWNYNGNDANCKDASSTLNEYNRLVLKAIRESKGNNLYRFYMATALAAGYGATVHPDFVLPEDPIDKNTQLPATYRITNRVLVSVHMYAPYDLVMNPNMEISKFTEDFKDQLYDSFKTLYTTFVQKGYHVVIGEMGVVNKNNTQDRIEWAKYYISRCRRFQFAAITWDNGQFDNTVSAEETYGFFDRNKLEWHDENLMNAFLRSTAVPLSDGDLELFEIELRDTFNTSYMIIDQKTKEFNITVSSRDLIEQMQFGWNLGNTFDAFSDEEQNQGLSSETSWGNPETSEEILDELVRKGFKAIRIPVTWHNHLIDDKYTIDPEWMTRVKTVVDWCLERGLYVIINTHHDNADYVEGASIKYGQGYYPLRKDMKESEKYLYNVWRQIAIAFNEGYDHHLIFEGLNEPRMKGMRNEWWFDTSDATCKEAADVLNEYNKLIVKAIRDTEGNNALRFLMVTGLAAAFDASMNSGLVIPEDKRNEDKRILLSVHMYSPYEFAMKPDMEVDKFTKDIQDQMLDLFKQLYFKYISKGIHVIVGEMGTVNKNNTMDRINWGVYYMKSARRFQFTPFIWDNNQYDNSKSCEETFGQFMRSDLTWANPEMIDVYLLEASRPLADDPELFRIEPVDTYDDLDMEIDYGQVDWDDRVTARQIAEEMGFGWNLGNTLDAFENVEQNQGVGSEMIWGNPETTEEMIDELVNTGFKAVRIPVTWHNHLIDDKYTIDPEWMWRVKTVVDWCIYKGLYVILNTHHDNANHNIFPIQYGQGYYPLNKDAEESERYIYNIWKQIATAFNNGYDHHLVFEGLNEPRMRDLEHEWWYSKDDLACDEAAEILNEYNKLVLKAIRDTGGNNEKRFVMVTPLAASYDFAMNSPFALPLDKHNPKNNKIIVSIHMYAPYDLVMNAESDVTRFTEAHKNELKANFQNLYNKFVRGGYTVIIGEFGAINKDNRNERRFWGNYYVTIARQNGMTPFIWDNGIWNNTETMAETYGLFLRDQLKWMDQDIVVEYLNAGRIPFPIVEEETSGDEESNEDYWDKYWSQFDN